MSLNSEQHTCFVLFHLLSLGIHVRRPTVRDVAEQAGVSISTVDRVISGRHAVKTDTAIRVYNAASALGFYAAGLMRGQIEKPKARVSLGFLLQRPDTLFRRDLVQAINDAVSSSFEFEISARIDVLDSSSPQSVANQMRDMARQVQAMAVATVDHPQITEAVAEVRSSGIVVLSLLSDFAQGVRSSYVGLDHRKVGRTAGWLIAHGARSGGEVALLVEGQQFAGHEIREISFLSYLREWAPHLAVVKEVNLDNRTIAREGTERLLKEHPDLAAIYIVGVGMEGAVHALREQQGDRRPFVVGHELTTDNRSALADRVINAVIATPLAQLARVSVQTMADAITNPGHERWPDKFLDLSIHSSENI